MNHVNDIAAKLRDKLNDDPAVYTAYMAQGTPDAERLDYPNRDGEWLVFVAMLDRRNFRIQVTADVEADLRTTAWKGSV